MPSFILAKSHVFLALGLGASIASAAFAQVTAPVVQDVTKLPTINVTALKESQPLQTTPVPVPAPQPLVSPDSSLEEPPPENAEEELPEPDLPSDEGNDAPPGPDSPNEG